MYVNEVSLDARDFSAKDKSRETLACLCIEPDCVVATNGRILVKIANPEAPKGEKDKGAKERILLPGDAIDVLKKIVGKKGMFKISEKDGKIWLEGKDATDRDFGYSVDKLTLSYPLYKNVFPDGSPQFSIALSAEYLRKIIDFAKKHGEIAGGSHRIQLSFYGRKDPVRFVLKTEEGQGIEGLIMPIITEDLYYADKKDEIIESICEVVDKRIIAEVLYTVADVEKMELSVRECEAIYKKASEKLTNFFQDAAKELKEEEAKEF